MPAAPDRSAATTNAPDSRNSTREAALRGALHAFARKPTLPVQPSPTSPSRGAASVAKRAPARPTTSSRLIEFVATNKTDESQPSGNTAGAVVAARSYSETSGSSSLADVQKFGSVDNLDGPAKSIELTGALDRPAQLELKIITSNTSEDGIIKAQGPAPDIHSPKPMRRVTAAASFEAAAIETKPQGLNLDISSDDGGVSLSSLSAEANVTPKLKSPSPSARRAKQQASRTDISAAPMNLARSQSLSEDRHVVMMVSEGSERDAAKSSAKKRPVPTRRVTQAPYQTLDGESTRRIDSLANAIVASHLASISRGTSPSKSPGPVAPSLPRRQTDKPTHHFSLFNRDKLDSRTPSPAKRMRQTLRKRGSDEDDDEQYPRRPRGHFHLRQHPHKHHEGDRKRWRDQITLRERKRYEGVWAANRDMCMRYTAEELESPSELEKAKGSVSALVVKEVWSRSRLPAHALEEVWDLVDRKQVGRLDREEFVVGMWLVDQRLKGRKLPPKVGSSVWQSVRGIYGLKVRKK